MKRHEGKNPSEQSEKICYHEIKSISMSMHQIINKRRQILKGESKENPLCNIMNEGKTYAKEREKELDPLAHYNNIDEICVKKNERETSLL